MCGMSRHSAWLGKACLLFQCSNRLLRWTMRCRSTSIVAGATTSGRRSLCSIARASGLMCRHRGWTTWLYGSEGAVSCAIRRMGGRESTIELVMWFKLKFTVLRTEVVLWRLVTVLEGPPGFSRPMAQDGLSRGDVMSMFQSTRTLDRRQAGTRSGSVNEH
jgi:hypothetical protein